MAVELDDRKKELADCDRNSNTDYLRADESRAGEIDRDPSTMASLTVYRQDRRCSAGAWLDLVAASGLRITGLGS
jgi:hypothetical protein